jgi:flagellar FliJ protein
MSFEFTLQKVLQVSEREKNQIQSEYQEAMNQFEKVATQLYELLKSKEELEQSARDQISLGTSVFSLQQSQNKMLRLQQEIQQKQRATQQARDQMNGKQQDLVDKTIELKKYEKMKQLKQEQFIQEQKRLELIQMDELSIQLFAKH